MTVAGVDPTRSDAVPATSAVTATTGSRRSSRRDAIERLLDQVERAEHVPRVRRVHREPTLTERYRVAAVLLVVVVAACGGGPGDGAGSSGAADGAAADRRLVRELEAAGYYDATGERDRRAVVRRFRGVCHQLDAAADEGDRYAALVSFLRASPSIASTGGWPAARVAGVAVPILCARHGDTLTRAVATVS